MGLRVNAYANCWDVKQNDNGWLRAKLTIGKKQDDGTYVNSFENFVSFGKKCSDKAKLLKSGDRIKVLECDATSTYNRETKEQKNYYTVYDFEPAASGSAVKRDVESDPCETSVDDEHVPF